jgi:hypothetical protein
MAAKLWDFSWRFQSQLGLSALQIRFTKALVGLLALGE